jgi:hypothetical protein
MTSHAGPEGPVLFGTIAGLAGRDPLLLATPKPHAGFLGAVGFARCLAGFAAKVVRLELDFLFGLTPDVLGTEA